MLPPDRRGGPPRNQRTRTARQMLESLDFDPLVEMVDAQRKFKTEAVRQEMIREGTLVELRQDGKPKAYSANTHHNAISESARISKDLAEYFYKKAAQEVGEGNMPIEFNINLTTYGESASEPE